MSYAIRNQAGGQPGKRLSVDSQIVRLGESSPTLQTISVELHRSPKGTLLRRRTLFYSHWVNHKTGRFEGLFWEEKKIMNSSGAYAHNFQNWEPTRWCFVNSKIFKFRANGGLEHLRNLWVELTGKKKTTLWSKWSKKSLFAGVGKKSPKLKRVRKV